MPLLVFLEIAFASFDIFYDAMCIYHFFFFPLPQFIERIHKEDGKKDIEKTANWMPVAYFVSGDNRVVKEEQTGGGGNDCCLSP
ncbi:hypothetical protein [Nostoc sp.]|uniref:hypothetical protein n=1 Tax=Nostoc sp. TaxID=1180 RepID=UPI002FF9B33B